MTNGLCGIMYEVFVFSTHQCQAIVPNAQEGRGAFPNGQPYKS